ncbi:MAG: alpha-mannosidase [Lachnospiraceae bacterium]
MDMFFLEKKIGKRIEEIDVYRYRNSFSLEKLYALEDTEKLVNPKVPALSLCTTEMELGSHWYGRDNYVWLQKKLEIPSEWSGKKVVGLFDFGKTDSCRNRNFEAMCYVDGAPYQGLDSNHKEVFFSDELIGRELTLAFRLWDGLEHGGVPTIQEHKLRTAKIAWLDETVDHFYYLASTIHQTLKEFTEEDATLFALRTILNRAFGMIDWSYPGDQNFYETVYAAYDYLNEAVDGLDKHARVTIKGIGHTHIDVAWMWRLKHTREKAQRSFYTVLRLMELFPEYIFLQTQPQIYEYIKQDDPILYEAIKQKVKEGTWEVEGAMWVEADCNLVSGESLTRQILVGCNFIKEEFGHECEYLWLPDVFGYSWALPQILKKSRIDTFMTTKISWSHYNDMPHDTFWWKGIDGTEILTYFITTPNEGRREGDFRTTYNGFVTPEVIKGAWTMYQDKELTDELLTAYGYGDGGGGVNRQMLETKRQIDRIPGLPHMKSTKAGAYFKELAEKVNETDQYVHTWDGELYLETHRGTYTSQAYMKKTNREMELLYRRVEMFSVLAALQSGDLEKAEQEKLLKGWKIILTNQFHDIIPGSSIREVYEDCVVDYGVAREIATQVLEDFYETCVEKETETLSLINTSNWEMDDLIFIEGTESIQCTDEQGNLLLTQKVDEGTYVEVKGVPALGQAAITLQKGDSAEAESRFTFNIEERVLETPFYRVQFNEIGQLSGLFDKRVEREVLAKGEVANVLQMFEDKPERYDAWDIELFYIEKMRVIQDMTDFYVKENGAIRFVLAIEYKYMNTTVEQDIVFYAKNPRIDFETKVDYHESHQLLKVAFPVNIRTTYATYDIQYGNVRRANNWNTSWEQAKFETVAHRFADLSERNYGVALLNNCKYGYDIKDNVLRMSLIKAATHPDYLQDQGLHEFTYSLLPHMGDFIDGDVVKQAFALNQPLCVVNGAMFKGAVKWFDIDSEEIEIDAIKKSEDGRYIVLRLHDFAGASKNISITPQFAYSLCAEANLREEPIEAFHKDVIQASMGPYEIKTFLFEL